MLGLARLGYLDGAVSMNSHPSHRTAFRGRLTGVSLALAFGLSSNACTLDMTGASRTNMEPSPVEGDADVRPELDAAPPDEEPSTREAGAARDGASALDANYVDAARPRPPAEDGSTQRDAGSEDARAAEDAALPPADAAVDESDASEVDAQVVVDATVPPPPPPQCVLEGTFAVQLEYDVDWRGTTLAGIIPLLSPGRGKVRVWSLIELRSGGTRARVRGCGATLPDFSAGNPRVGNELYSAYIPASTWDQPNMPRWDLALQPTCLEPGCKLTSSPLATTVGARVSGNSPWPGPNGSLSGLMLVDHDGDEAPGVTLFTRPSIERSPAGTPYIEPPLTWTLTSRATQLYMAFQIAFQLDGALESCDAWSGALNQGRVENRVASCYARSSGGEGVCSPEQARFADQNLPEWSVTAGRFRAKRVATGASCADTRAALD